MALIGRNERCPCGSGKKYKRCCIERESELVRQADAIEVLLALPTLFPLLRPLDGEFEQWLAEHAVPEPSTDLIEEGIERLPAAERDRISRAHGDSFPHVWEGLLADVCDERLARDLVVNAAVAAALSEERALDPQVVELIESADAPDDAAETLALALEPWDFWSIVETTEAEKAVARIPGWLDDHAYEKRWDETFERETARHWSGAHERRLELLVARVRAQLPLERYPRASTALAEATALFERDPALRRRLAAALLVVAPGPLGMTPMYSALAA